MWSTRLHPDFEEELKQLKGSNNKLLTKVIFDVRLLREFGLELLETGRVKKLSEEIFELRTKQASNIYRTLFGIRPGRLLVLSAGFMKKTGKTPKGWIDVAEQRLEEWDRSQ